MAKIVGRNGMTVGLERYDSNLAIARHDIAMSTICVRQGRPMFDFESALKTASKLGRRQGHCSGSATQTERSNR